MTERAAIDTGWVRSVAAGVPPDGDSLRDHLNTVHSRYAGFTESCAARCRDAEGRNSYEWLAAVIEPPRHARVLDLACGSGVLLDICRQRFGATVALTGVDMSSAELALASTRLPCGAAVLHCALAQQLDMLANDSMDAVLCHWALTLMDPVLPALREARRVLRPGGVFAAIIDGDMASAAGYAAVHDLIYGRVRREVPGYGEIDMGDARVREAGALSTLTAEAFGNATVTIAPAVVTLNALPDVLAREAAGFFYAAFVLSTAGYAAMLEELEAHFATCAARGQGGFAMPINRLVVINPV